MFRRLWGSRRGAIAIEDRLTVSLVAIVATSAMRNLGNQLGNSYRSTAAKISAAGA